VNVYEGMFILDSNRYARDPGGVPRHIDELIKKRGGEVLVSRLWVEQKLAFPIKGQSKGTYWLIYFRLDSSRLTELKHQVKLSDSVLRSLVLKIDPRLVDAMVAHASPRTRVVTPDEPDEVNVDDDDLEDEPAEVEASAVDS
jgi:small subunit ribosomal protein S6